MQIYRIMFGLNTFSDKECDKYDDTFMYRNEDQVYTVYSENIRHLEDEVMTHETTGEGEFTDADRQRFKEVLGEEEYNALLNNEADYMELRW